MKTEQKEIIKQAKTITDLNKVIKLMAKIKKDNVFCGIIIDNNYYFNFYYNLVECTEILKKETKERTKNK